MVHVDKNLVELRSDDDLPPLPEREAAQLTTTLAPIAQRGGVVEDGCVDLRTSCSCALGLRRLILSSFSPCF